MNWKALGFTLLALAATALVFVGCVAICAYALEAVVGLCIVAPVLMLGTEFYIRFKDRFPS